MMLIVVTGTSGSGKSTLSHILSELTGLPVRNVGDLLFRALRREGCPVRTRVEIGATFLAEFGEAGYLRLLEGLFTESAVVDGLRMVDGLAVATASGRPLLHIHRPPPPGRDGTGDFQSDLISSLADTLVPWARTRVELRDWARRAVEASPPRIERALSAV